jgi:uncharacterized protein (TIGR03435 family)
VTYLRSAVVFVLLMSGGTMLFAQTTKPTFEVAPIRRSEPGTRGGRVRFLPGGRFIGENIPLDFLIQQVYGVRDFQIIAEPKWRAIIADGHASRYQIQAQAHETATPEQLKEMVKTLLADRFALQLHTEARELPIYALIPAKGGIKPAHAVDGFGGGVASMLPGWIRGKGVTAESLAQTLSRYVDRPVINTTNTDQLFDFDLTWTPEAAVPAGDLDPGGCPSSFREMTARFGWKLNATCPSIFAAVEEQLGMRLDSRQSKIDVLVIDSVLQPTENQISV